MCNLSENIEERSIKRERLNAVRRMIKGQYYKTADIIYGIYGS